MFNMKGMGLRWITMDYDGLRVMSNSASLDRFTSSPVMPMKSGFRGCGGELLKSQGHKP